MTNAEMEMVCFDMYPEIREELHNKLAPCNDILFLTEYCKRDPYYKETLGEDFFLYVDKKYTTWEEPYQGKRFTLSEMEGIYNKDVDKKEYTTFLNWMWDMRRCDIFTVTD